jgi:DNA-binding transcriptional MerR regulator
MKDLSIKKLYYSISEVSKITNIEQYVLRYWETEFEQLKPQKNRAGNRIYTNKEIQLILHIKTLLRERKYTIEGAKKIMENYAPEKVLQTTDQDKEIIELSGPQNNRREKTTLQNDLEEVKRVLELLVSKL